MEGKTQRIVWMLALTILAIEVAVMAFALIATPQGGGESQYQRDE